MKTPFSKITQYLWLNLLLVGVAGCGDLFDLFDNQDKHFPLEDSFKIKFKKGDTLNYFDQHGNRFQLLISEIVHDQRSVSRKGSGGPYNIYDRETVHYDSIFVAPALPKPGLDIYTRQKENNVTWPPALYGSGTVPYYKEITLNNIVYQDVYKYTADPRPPASILTWYYSYAYGFVAFEQTNGRIYTLLIP